MHCSKEGSSAQTLFTFMLDTNLSSLVIWFPDWSRLKAKKITHWEEGGGPAGDLLATKKETETWQTDRKFLTETSREEGPGLFRGTGTSMAPEATR